MNVPAELRKLLASLEARLVDNGRDIGAVNDRLADLAKERRETIYGVEGIKSEIKRLETKEGD